MVMIYRGIFGIEAFGTRDMFSIKFICRRPLKIRDQGRLFPALQSVDRVIIYMFLQKSVFFEPPRSELLINRYLWDFYTMILSIWSLSSPKVWYIVQEISINKMIIGWIMVGLASLFVSEVLKVLIDFKMNIFIFNQTLMKATRPDPLSRLHGTVRPTVFKSIGLSESVMCNISKGTI